MLRIAYGCVCLGLFIHVLGYAWIIDDSYVTFRVADNLLHGYGLRWNIDERVQTFTNPLWLFLHLPLYALTDNMFLVTIFLSAVLGAAAVALLLRSVPAAFIYRFLLVLAPIACSRIFKELIITGLEVPLVLALLAWFWYVLIRRPERGYLLVFIASLSMFTRLDAVVILAPALAFVGLRFAFRWWKEQVAPSFARLMLASLPITGWLGFCLFYYGFLFPNTKYAKLGTGLSQATYWRMGGCYIFEEFPYYDAFSFWWTMAALGCAYGCFIWMGICLWLRKAIAWPAFVIFLMGGGMALHLLYVHSIGGDFVPGRFVVAPFFLGVFLLYYAATTLPVQHKPLIAAGLLVLCVPSYVRPAFPAECNIGNEMAFYRNLGHGFITRGHLLTHVLKGHLFSAEKIHSFMRFDLPEMRHRQRKVAEDFDTRKPVIVWGMIGVKPYVDGPGFVVIDNLALSEPLLARLPAETWHWLYVAHYRRSIPRGYLYARKTGDLSRMNPDLAFYYGKLRLVTSGDLFDIERLRTILGFQMGKYDIWRARYLAHSR